MFKLVNTRLTNNEIPGRDNFFKHPIISNERSEFSIDLCCSLTFADIPLYKVKLVFFREFLENTIPDKLTPGKMNAPSNCHEIVQD